MNDPRSEESNGQDRDNRRPGVAIGGLSASPHVVRASDLTSRFTSAQLTSMFVAGCGALGMTAQAAAHVADALPGIIAALGRLIH